MRFQPRISPRWVTGFEPFRRGENEETMPDKYGAADLSAQVIVTDLSRPASQRRSVTEFEH